MFNCFGKEENEDWRDYTCDICGEELPTKGGLKRHKTFHSIKSRTVELPPKSFVCDYPGCDKAFDTLPSLNAHKTSHSTKRRRKDAGSSQS